MTRLLVLLLPILFSCSSVSSKQKNPILDHKLFMATLWAQNAGEYQALSYQAYQLARLRLDENLKLKSKLPMAVVVDVDETVLDNSVYQGQLIKDGKSHSQEQWREWIALKIARSLPGAVDFINYAQSKKVEVFYISNRYVDEMEDTFENLVQQGFKVKKDNLIFRSKSSPKEERRLKVAANYNIVLFIGDNLGDFSGDFEKKNLEDRNQAVGLNKAEFGKRFIVLPNPMYGDWEAAIFNHQWSLPPEELDLLRAKHLQTYR